MIATTTTTEMITHIEGPAGQLELIVGEPTGEERGACAIVCHPHPLYGGTMHNKVVTTLVKTFQYLGLNTVRFNFRGVGKSAGQYDNGDGELDDLLAVIAWVKRERPQFDIWLAGFSFGGYIAATAATQTQIKQLVLIAPAIEHFPMQSLPPFTCPWVVVQGEQDDVVSPQAVLSWAESREPKPIIIRFPEAGHFFHGQLSELRERLEEVLQ